MPARDDLPYQALPDRDVPTQRITGVLTCCSLKHQVTASRVDQRQSDCLYLQGLHTLVKDALQHFIQTQRSVDGSRAFSQCCHHARLALAFRVQAGIQYCNSRLIGNGLHQLQVFRAKGVCLRMYQCQHPHQFLAREQRNT